MKNTALTILVSVTLALVCALFVLDLTGVTIGPGTAATGSGVSRQDIITVYGQGKVSLKPDVAYLTCGYENIGKNAKTAQNINSKEMKDIIDAIKNAGIKDEEIQTSQYNVYQMYENNGGERVVTGYRVTNIIVVKISDVDKAGEIINTAADAGANVFNGISFDVIEKQQAYLDAMDIALDRAGEKAQVYAQKEGREITGVLEIIEGSAPTQTYRSLTTNSVSINGYALSGQGVTAADTISSGQVELTATVTVVYGMK